MLAIGDVRVALEHRKALVTKEVHRDAVGHARLTKERRVGVAEHVRRHAATE